MLPLPQLRFVDGRGSATHRIEYPNGSLVAEIFDAGGTDDMDRRLGRALAAAPALLSACWAAKLILSQINEEYDWLPDEQLLLDAALAECSIAIRQTEDPHSQLPIREELARR